MDEPISTPTKLDLSQFMNTSPPGKATLLSQNIKEDHVYFHFDFTVIITILIICITIITLNYLSNKKKDSK